jgi:hypothetical protein
MIRPDAIDYARRDILAVAQHLGSRLAYQCGANGYLQTR